MTTDHKACIVKRANQMRKIDEFIEKYRPKQVAKYEEDGHTVKVYGRPSVNNG